MSDNGEHVLRVETPGSEAFEATMAQVRDMLSSQNRLIEMHVRTLQQIHGLLVQATAAMGQQGRPVVNIEPPRVTVEPPDVDVQVAAPEVTVQAPEVFSSPPADGRFRFKVHRDSHGWIDSVDREPI